MFVDHKAALNNDRTCLSPVKELEEMAMRARSWRGGNGGSGGSELNLGKYLRQYMPPRNGINAL